MKDSSQIRFRATADLMLLLYLGAVLAGCASSDSPTESAALKWTVHGKVAYVGSIAPRSGITVRCAEATATSGEDGSYDLKDIPEGTHNLTAEAPGCKPYLASIEVKSDTKHFIYLERIGATLSGYVSNMLDGPIKGALVTTGGLSDITDAAGKFLLSEVPLKPDSLTVSHPNYISTKVAFAAEGPEALVNVSLKRDSVFFGNIIADNYVDESQPSLIGYGSLLYLSGSGTGTIRRHIYIDFEFPAFMRDPQVQLISGSLELCGEPGQPTSPFQVYTVTSQWQWWSLSYSRQPTTGSQLATGTAGSSTAPQYWTILNTTALSSLLSVYRADGLIYGIVIRGGISNLTRSFYSTRAGSNPPRVSFKVRF